MLKIKILILLVSLLFLIISSNISGYAEEPQLKNEMPEELESFQERVERQALDYPQFFFLRGNLEKKEIALTFDDGPDSKYTPTILDILKEKDVPATFFLLGENILHYPGIIDRIAQEGHLIANHSWSHRNFEDLSPEEVLDEELLPTQALIQNNLGRDYQLPKIIRPPYGFIPDETIEYLGEKEWKVVNWSVDTFDWDSETNSPDNILERVKKYAHPGGVILLHSGGGNRENTVEALPEIISFLQKEGYEFITIDKMF